MIKFSNSAINNCDFTNVNIECYEPNTCGSTYYNGNQYSDDAEFQKVYRKCTEKEIDEILSGLNLSRKSNNSYLLLVIVGSIIIIFIGVLITFILIKKKKSNKTYEIDTTNEFRSGSIRVVLNINERNNSSNNVNTEINNNHNNNYNSLNMQIPPPSYENKINIINNDETNIYNVSFDEIEDSLPEYTVTDQLNE